MNIDPDRFVAAVQPLLERRDHQALYAFLRENYTADQIVGLLASAHCDARKVAALALSLVGGQCCIDPLVKQLADPDPVVNNMSEHALWSIWFRMGSPEANQALYKGSEALSQRQLDCAVDHFTQAIRNDPNFAEAYNQRAIAYYLKECFEDSIRDCRRTVKRMPCHFGAWAGMGHCHAHLGQLDKALCSYEHALEINPHIECVRQAVKELKQKLSGPDDV